MGFFKMLLKSLCKIRLIILILILLLLLLIFLKVRKTIFTNAENENYMIELKKKFNEDTFIAIDEINTKIEQSRTETIEQIIHKMDDTYINKELSAELLRRQKFNFYWRLKTKRINESLPRIIFSFSQNKFINNFFNDDDWQLNVFGISKPYILNSLNHNPSDQFPEVANGYLGINGFSDVVQMQSLFSSSYMESHRAAIPSWTIRNITAIYDLNGHNIVNGRRLELDMSNGRLVQILFSDHCIVEQQIYAHQTLKSLIVHEIQVQFINSTLDVIVLNLPKDRKRDISSNIDITDKSINSQYFKIMSGVTHTNDLKEHEQNIVVYYHPIPEEIRITKSDYVVKHYFLISINEDKEITRQHFDEGMVLMENNNKLFKYHDSVWKHLWSNTVVFMRRSNSLDVSLISAQYLINSNLPSIGKEDLYGAMGATGLGVVSNQGAGHSMETNCGGRIEFTQELWMANSQILLHSMSVKSMINKRILQLPMAKNSATYFDFSGAKYPAVTNELGEELCKSETFCENIIFPSGLVAMTIRKYLLATGDKSMFTNETCLGVLKEINEFWKSVLKKKDMELVSLSNLKTTVKKSVFNMALIKEGLLIIPALVNFFNIKPDNKFANYILELHKLSDSINIPYDKIKNHHPPHDLFNYAEDKVYLPEGVMLRYPLDYPVDVETSGKNLRFYEKRLVLPQSPMSLSIMFINNLDAERITAAEKNFHKLITFSDNTFKIWSNDSNLWKGSYIPAASSYLDSVTFGLFGIRIRRSGLYLCPKLILDISFIEISSLQYLGSTIKVSVDRSKGLYIQLISTKPHALKLGVMDYNTKNIKVLEGRVTFPLSTHIVIRRMKPKSTK